MKGMAKMRPAKAKPEGQGSGSGKTTDTTGRSGGKAGRAMKKSGYGRK